MNDCYVDLMGRLGNQLFQAATGYEYAKNHNKSLKLNYTNCVKFGFNLDRSGNCYSETIFKNFTFQSPIGSMNYIQENAIDFPNIPAHDGSVVLNGYFQSLEYFKKHCNEFISNLELPNIAPLENMDIAFHIRRGDYLGIDNARDICGTEYFNKCFYKYKGFNINVFTESPDYVRSEFPTESFKIVENNTELQDLTLISNHDIVVCSNSSFSWWASLLGKPKKEIIVPNRWWVNDEFIEIYRPEFIKICI